MTTSSTKSFREWLLNNSLSILFFGLFLMSLVVQSVSGLHSFNDLLHVHGRPPTDYLHFLGTGTFLDSVFSNWQAAFFQITCLVLFAKGLYQKGASHSRKPEHRKKSRAAKSRREPWLYRNSFAVALGVVFVGAWVAHIFFGTMAYNEMQSLDGQAPVSVASYLSNGAFWFNSTQTWQAEFVAIGAFLVMSIYLREEGSPESKPVGSRKETTGEVYK